MKYAIIIPDGCADHLNDFQSNKTPLFEAKLPNLDQLANAGIVGRSWNVPLELLPGSDVATLSVLGYNPQTTYTGRAPLEAAAQGISVGPDDWAFRCNLVNITQGLIMKSFTAGHITSGDAAEIINDIGPIIANIAAANVEFYPGVSYRNLMLYRGAAGTNSPFDLTTQTVPPHDYTDQSVVSVFPQGAGNELLRCLMEESARLLENHKVNLRRIASGELPATHFWLWGQGKRPNLQIFSERFPKVHGAMISAVDLLIGIAKLIGWESISVPGITGYIDTDYAAKGNYAAKALEQFDLVCVHVEAPDEASHEGSFEKKVAAMEAIDEKVVPPILEKLKSYSDWRILVTPDHPTSIKSKTHSHEMVPWIVAGSDIPAMNLGNYNELTAKESPFFLENGWKLMDRFIGAFAF